MKKCKCGTDMEDWKSVCNVCYGKQQDAKPESKDRQNSIERQVAAKCVAQALTGQMSVSEGDVTRSFNLFLKLIRGE